MEHHCGTLAAAPRRVRDGVAQRKRVEHLETPPAAQTSIELLGQVRGRWGRHTKDKSAHASGAQSPQVSPLCTWWVLDDRSRNWPCATRAAAAAAVPCGKVAAAGTVCPAGTENARVCPAIS